MNKAMDMICIFNGETICTSGLSLEKTNDSIIGREKRMAEGIIIEGIISREVAGL